MKKIPMMENYLAIQGEGSLTGAPSLFIRLFGCNLHCYWCDTAYSINHKEAEKTLTSAELASLYTLVSPEELRSLILRSGTEKIVFTGGEPMLWWKRIREVISTMAFKDYHITIETNGTIIPSSPGLIDLWSVSPKLEGTQTSNKLEKRRLVNLKEWTRIQTLDVAEVQLKYIIQSSSDLDQVKSLLSSRDLYLEDTKVILTPNGDFFNSGREFYWKAYASIVKEIIDDPFWALINVFVLPQLHILAYGRKRYV